MLKMLVNFQSPIPFCFPLRAMVRGCVLIVLAATPWQVSAQNAQLVAAPTEVAKDSGAPQAFTLRQLLEAALATHPSLQAARLQAHASAQDVSATERQRWPTIAVTTETDTGTRASVATRSLRVEQIVWDAGRNTARIAESENRLSIAHAQVRLQQQDLFIQIINAWQSLVGAVERKTVAEDTLVLLQGYQTQMLRRVEAQASTRIDLELVDARVLQTEVEKTTADTSLKVALTRLEQLSGLSGLSRRLGQLPSAPSYDSTELFHQILEQTDWQIVASDQAAVNKARLERELVKTQLTTKQAEQWPQLYVRIDKPLATTQANPITTTSVFAGLRYTPGAGFATALEAQAIATRIQSQDQTIEAVSREVQQSLENDREEFANARLRIVALEKSVKGSRLVLESYLRQFQAGRKTWQDLLNTARDLAQNQYSLADAKSSLVGALHRLQLRMDKSPEFP
jgi:adhesin transport system outer membrane protein